AGRDQRYADEILKRDVRLFELRGILADQEELLGKDRISRVRRHQLILEHERKIERVRLDTGDERAAVTIGTNQVDLRQLGLEMLDNDADQRTRETGDDAEPHRALSLADRRFQHA